MTARGPLLTYVAIAEMCGFRGQSRPTPDRVAMSANDPWSTFAQLGGITNAAYEFSEPWIRTQVLPARIESQPD